MSLWETTTKRAQFITIHLYEAQDNYRIAQKSTCTKAALCQCEASSSRQAYTYAYSTIKNNARFSLAMQNIKKWSCYKICDETIHLTITQHEAEQTNIY